MAQRQKLQKTSAWQRLKSRWNRKGVVEIDMDHPSYNKLCCIRQGIREVLLDCPDVGPKENLETEDYDHVIEKNITCNGKTYTFCSYASSVFATMRRAIDVSEEQYQKSLAPPYLKFISNSNSQQDFYLSTDMQYFLKTDKTRSVEFFRSILRDYLGHFQSNPHSLLVKYLGLYSMSTGRSRKKYFFIMQSVFFPSDRVESRFDIKGCFAGRYQQPNRPGSHDINILKDKNFREEIIDLGSQRDWFMQQLETDTDFLCNLGVIDYSLLIGRQHLHNDEKRESISNLVCRMQKSLYDPATGNTEALETAPVLLDPRRKSIAQKSSTIQRERIYLPGSVNNLDDYTDEAVPFRTDASGHENRHDNSATQHPQSRSSREGQASPDPVNGNPVQQQTSRLSPTTTTNMKSSASNYPSKKSTGERSENRLEVKRRSLVHKDTLVSLTDSEYLDEQGVANRRLLPNCKNALHMIDGPDLRYFLGIIDFLVVYGYVQRMDSVRKSIKYSCGDHSTLPPKKYAARFVRFISERTI